MNTALFPAPVTALFYDLNSKPRFASLSVCLSVCLFAALIIPGKPCPLCSVLDVVIKIFIRCHCLRHHAPLLQVLPVVPDFLLNFREIRFVPDALVTEWTTEKSNGEQRRNLLPSVGDTMSIIIALTTKIPASANYGPGSRISY